MVQFKKAVICTFLSDTDVQVKWITTTLLSMGVEILPGPEMASADIMIAVGGDGTLLQYAKDAYQYGIPILGVNAGRVGFLADVEYSNTQILEAIFSGHYLSDERMLLECEVLGRKHIAVNEVMFSKSESTRMIRYEVFIDDRFMFDQIGDGLVVATPTGSTAYALSAGGQIIHPDLDAISLVPICARYLSSRPVVIPPNACITVNLQPWKGSQSNVAIDANILLETESVSKIMIRRAEKPLTLIHPRHYDYYRTLQAKLNWETTV